MGGLQEECEWDIRGGMLYWNSGRVVFMRIPAMRGKATLRKQNSTITATRACHQTETVTLATHDQQRRGANVSVQRAGVTKYSGKDFSSSALHRNQHGGTAVLITRSIKSIVFGSGRAAFALVSL